MKAYRLAAVVLTLGLLTGCASLLERSYTASEPHSSKFWESEAAATLRAENRQDMVNDLLILISQHTETASLRLYNFPDEQTALEELEKAAQEVARLYRESGAERLVVGLPRNMDGSEGPRAELCRAFAARLAELTGAEPVMWDERRTTVEAHAILSANGKKTKKHRQTVDAVAAGLILEGYLGKLRLENK